MVIRYAEVLVNHVKYLVEAVNGIRRRTGIPDVDLTVYNSGKNKNYVRGLSSVSPPYLLLFFSGINSFSVFLFPAIPVSC